MVTERYTYRNGMVDIWRFVFCLLIMAHHMYHIGIERIYPFQSAWIYVEFFFILSGYFTGKHFWGGNTSTHKAAKSSMVYTIKKFKNVLPYSTIIIFGEYLLGNICFRPGSWKNFIESFENMPYEMMMVSSSGLVEAKVVPIWYLSAMFLVFPIFCYLVQRYEQLFQYILSWFIPVIYYGRMGIVARAEWPHDLLRAFSCMCLGGFVYTITEFMKEMKYTKLTKVILTLIGICCFLLTIILTERNSMHVKTIFLCLFLGIVILFSDQSYTNKVHGKICGFFGRISLVIYLSHWGIGTLISCFLQGGSWRLKVFIYFVGSILWSLFLYLLVDICWRKLRCFIILNCFCKNLKDVYRSG